VVTLLKGSSPEDDFGWAIKNTVVPRPIAWVSTRGDDGTANVAPFSFFNLLTLEPPTLYVSFGGPRDTLGNIRSTGSFVVNLVSEDLIEKVALTAVPFPSSVDEAERAGLALAESDVVAAPRLKDAKVSLECVFEAEQRVHGSVIVFGEIVAIHIKDDVLKPNGRPDYARYRPVGRMGGSEYAVIPGSTEVRIPVLQQKF